MLLIPTLPQVAHGGSSPLGWARLPLCHVQAGTMGACSWKQCSFVLGTTAQFDRGMLAAKVAAKAAARLS
eukprot:1160405-Pelagomonas_calceolata.AAC.6